MIKKVSMSKLLMISVVMLSFSFLASSAQTKLTLDKAISIALQNNAQTAVSKLEVQKAQAAVDEAYGYAMPSVGLNAQYYYYLEKMKMPFPDFNAMLNNSVYGVLFKEGVLPEDPSKYLPMAYSLQSFSLSNNYSASIEVNQVLFNSAVFRGIGASQIYLDASKVRLRSNVATTVFDVKKAFYGVLLLQDLLGIMEASLENAQNNYNNVVALQQQGLVSEYDAMQVEVQVENLKPQVENIRNQLENAKNGLKVILSIDQSEEIEVDGSLNYDKMDGISQQEFVSKAMKQNLDIISMEYKVQVDEAFIDLDRSEYWPAVYAFGNYQFNGSSDDLNFQNYQQSMVGISLQMNLFNGFQTTNRKQQAEINMYQSQEQLDMLKDFTASQVKAKILDLQRVEKLLDAQEKNVTLAQKAYDISLRRYQEGEGTQLEIKNADIELRTARTNRLQSVYDYIVAKSELEKLLGEVDKKYYEEIDILKNN
jgi:outer membrane protein